MNCRKNKLLRKELIIAFKIVVSNLLLIHKKSQFIIAMTIKLVTAKFLNWKIFRKYWMVMTNLDTFVEDVAVIFIDDTGHFSQMI